MFFAKKRTLKGLIHIDGVALPVRVALDLASGHYYSLTTRRITLRLPVTASEGMIRDYLHTVQEWVKMQFEQQPAYRDAYFGKQFRDGELLQVGERKYVLALEFKDRVTSSARLVGDTICLEMNENLNAWQRTRTAKTLLSRIVAKDFQGEISRRVTEMNARTFRQPIKSINLKYNHSNWGSCSSAGNVNLSTRLLFAPREVQDYVILHELAHLIEMNHSDRFWALVERYMPKYQEAEKWLKDNRAKCDF
ncbi:MAG TPA: M48 family metallopeptidase [Saprospiraceae bacterium]|nr:M48 family metallopeptidase [Saprospiraceae bacterium]